MKLEKIIVERIPPAMLERVVYDQGLIDAAARETLYKASGLAWEEIVKRTVEIYGSQTPQLAYGLYDQINQTDYEAARLLYPHFQGRIPYSNHQASLVGRVPTLSLEELGDFLKTVKRCVCLIVSRPTEKSRVMRGTGFLVAPSLVLTCDHVLKGFPRPLPDQLPEGSCIELYFDFLYGEPVENVSPALPHARKVGLASNWVAVSSGHIVPDGIEGELDAATAERIAKALDFVLLRLDQPVGLQPLSRGGGPRRGWVSLPPDAVPQALEHEDWIIIPQHPNGFPQRIDLGRFKANDQTGTRIRYLTNTANGSSGAPCFNQKFKLVGLHNAYVGPEDDPLANQAIRFDHIAQLVRGNVAGNLDGSNALRWSISRDREDPRVILGREKLLTWLTKTKLARLEDRVYAARATLPQAGCSFSIEVLHAEIRDSKIPRAVYGKRGQQIPDTPEDFLHSLLRELGIDHSKVEQMPERPRQATGQGPSPPLHGEIDKRDRWLATDLPEWLGRVITSHVEQTVDARVAARQSVASYEQLNLQPPPDVKAQAEAGAPINVRPVQWDTAYVVIDDLRVNEYVGDGPRTELKGEVRALVSALVKGKQEDSMDPGLKRLRWMFLGYLPDFIAAADSEGNGATFEPLDPKSIGVDDVLAVFERMAQTYIPMQEELKPVAARALAVTMVHWPDTQGTSLEKRLASLQGIVGEFSKNLLKEITN
jgi:Trypsin-like peptidase domain